MKFSFNKAPNKPKASLSDAFQTMLISQPIGPKSTSKQHHQSDQTSADTAEQKLDEMPATEDPCALFHRYYDEAVCYAENDQFSDSLRCFDVAIRFWNVYALDLPQMYPDEYAKFAFPDINTCEVSKYFINEYKQKKSHCKATNKTLWKPPPKNQPSSTKVTSIKMNEKPVGGGDDSDADEIIFFDDDDDEHASEHGMQLEPCANQENGETIVAQKKTEIESWKTLVLEHRNIGSKMFEYQAQILLELGRDFAAIKSSHSAIWLNPSNAINWLTLARAELNFKDPFQALQSISKAVELDFENDEIIEQYAAIHAICEHGMDENVLCRRLVDNNNVRNLDECMEESKAVKQRLEKRQCSKQINGDFHKIVQMQN